MGKKRELIRLGTFELTSTVLRVSDPCYEPDTWCAGTIENCKPGTWEAAVIRSDEGWGIRCAALIARHIDGPKFDVDECLDRPLTRCNFEVGVDSGQAGIYDEAHYQDDTVFGGEKPDHDYGSVWYGHNCDATLSDIGAEVIPYGAVSSSGYGDGGYSAYEHTISDGVRDGVCVVFFWDDDEEEDDEDDDECEED